MKGDEHLPEQEIRRRAISGFKWAAVGKVIITGYSWLVTMLMIRLLTPADYGLQAMWEGPLELAALLGVWCLDQALIRQRVRDRETLAEMFGLMLFTNTAASCALYFAAPAIAGYFNTERLTLILQVLAIPILLAPLRVIPNALLDLEMKFKLKVQIEIASSIVAITTGLILAVKGVGVWALVAVMVLEPTLRIAIMAIRLPWIVMPKIPSSKSQQTVSVALNLLLGAAIILIGSKAMQIIAGPNVGPEILGYLTFAMTLGYMPLIKLMPILNQILFPTFANLRNQEDAKKYLFSALEISLIILTPLCIGIAATATLLVPTIFGSQWIGASIALTVIAPQVPLRLINNLTNMTLNARGHILAVNKLSTFIALSNLLFTYPASLFGLEGLLLFSVITTGFYLVGTLILLRIYLDFQIRDLIISGRTAFVSSSAMLVVCLVADYFLMTITISDISRLLTIILFGAMTYGGALIIIFPDRIRVLLNAFR